MATEYRKTVVGTNSVSATFPVRKASNYCNHTRHQCSKSHTSDESIPREIRRCLSCHVVRRCVLDACDCLRSWCSYKIQHRGSTLCFMYVRSSCPWYYTRRKRWRGCTRRCHSKRRHHGSSSILLLSRELATWKVFMVPGAHVRYIVAPAAWRD